nr:hypothetical protein [Tanacetum cinerariifolium]
MLVKEYRDGILLFQLMDQKVWTKAIEDTAGLKKFFQANQTNYQFGQRARGTVISAATPQLLARAQRELATRRYPVAGRPGTVLVHFKPGTATLATANGSANLDDLAKRLTGDTTLTATVAGHIKRGESPALARQRATAAINYLVKTGKADRRQLTLATAPAITADGDTRFTLYTTATSALEASLNAQNPLAVQIQQRIFQKGDNKVMDDYLTRPAGTYTTQRDGRYYAVVVNQTLPPGPKALSDARGQATSDYQTYLEKQWIEQLRQQYPVKRLPTLAILALFSLLAMPQASHAQLGISRPRGQELVDGIAVKVDNQIVLRSDVDNIMAQEVARAQGKPLPPDLRCKILQSLVLNRLMLARAEVDSVTVTDQQVSSELDRRMAYFV